MSTARDFDIAVIGAGMAGASAAAHLAADNRVALLEAEDVAGYHTTGRSAAIWIQNYGPPDVRVLTVCRARSSRPARRVRGNRADPSPAGAYVATAAQLQTLEAVIANGLGIRRISVKQAEAWSRRCDRLPRRRGVGGRCFRHGCRGDPSGLSPHAPIARRCVGLHNRVGRIERRDGMWEVEAAAGDVFRAPVVVNAAGAWGDEVGRSPRGAART